MPRPVRVVHYVNQVYAGIGRDESADLPMEVRDRPVGPARLLNHLMGDGGEVVATIVCGDGYFELNGAECLSSVDVLLRESMPDVVVAGPAFELASYGLACVSVCQAASGLGIPSVAAMASGNPSRPRVGAGITVIESGSSPGDMMETLGLVCRAVLRR